MATARTVAPRRNPDPIGRLDILAERILSTVIGPNTAAGVDDVTISKIVRGLGIPSRRVFTRKQAQGFIEAGRRLVR